MEREEIKQAIINYFDNKSTDYAVMISGDWGSGKTYFLRNDIFSYLRDEYFRPIYISLIGLRDEDKLEKKIFEKINPFFQSTKKSQIASEADRMERLLNKEDEKSLDIPKKIVLCFDDLERINIDFFETALGFINTFIEHNKIKCIFLCNESKLEKKIPDFRNTKEKYIRYTYFLKSNIENIIQEELLKNQEKYINLKDFDISVISEMFRKGKCYNVRTLLFTLSLLNTIVEKLNTNIILNNIDKKYIIELITRYLCFVCIEQKKGISKQTIDKISVAYVTKNPIMLFEEGFQLDLISSESNNNDSETKVETENKTIEDLIQVYFSADTSTYNQFLSISKYVFQGLFDLDIFKKEIGKLDVTFYNKEQRLKKNQIKEITTNPYNYSNKDIVNNLNSISDEVEKGVFDLKECIQLYSNLLWISSFNLNGYKVTDEITDKFKKGAEKFIELNNPDYIPHLTEFTDWKGSDELANKFREFKKFIDNKNDELNIKFNETTIDDIISSIKENNELHVYNFLINKDSSAYLTEEDAHKLFDTLMIAEPKTTNKVFQGFLSRYANDGMIISQMLRIEVDFITELFSLIKKSEQLQSDSQKELSYIPIFLLGNHLEKLIKQHDLKSEKNEK
jgi:type II secretory pathway predicted ATPase ExeA